MAASNEFNPDSRENWIEIFEQSAYTLENVVKEFGITKRWFNKFLYELEEPRTKRQAEEFGRFCDAMAKIAQTKKIPYHPSYGYATHAQFKELTSLPLGSRREELVKQIELQTICKGKVR